MVILLLKLRSLKKLQKGLITSRGKRNIVKIFEAMGPSATQPRKRRFDVGRVDGRQRTGSCASKGGQDVSFRGIALTFSASQKLLTISFSGS